MKEYKLEHDFQNNYYEVLYNASKIASNAKKYIMNNYKSITDWSELSVTVIDGRDGNTVEFYNFDTCSAAGGFIGYEPLKNTLNKWRKEKHNPIVSLTDCCLDKFDDDFSLTINGIEFYWIDDEAVIEIANYIERHIKH
jgi:hypothetical protein